MIKIVRNAILLNVGLSLIYIYSSIITWSYANNLSTNKGCGTYWDPLLIKPWLGGPLNLAVPATFNLPFLTFWLFPIANAYVIIRIMKEKASVESNSKKHT